MTEFRAQVERFAKDVGRLTDLLELESHELDVEFVSDKQRATVTLKPLVDGKTFVRMRAGGEWSCGIAVRFGCRPDGYGRHMAATLANFAVYSSAERSPLFRLEYVDEMRSYPSCHWQVHGERGALSHLLTLSGHAEPSRMSALHLPVGGSRMRPALEDFLHFLIAELGADAADGWLEVIEDSRSTWRTRQIRALVRDVPDAAIAELDDLGYTITPPNDGVADARSEVLRDW